MIPNEEQRKRLSRAGFFAATPQKAGKDPWSKRMRWACEIKPIPLHPEIVGFGDSPEEAFEVAFSVWSKSHEEKNDDPETDVH